jgi:hypothetical protein
MRFEEPDLPRIPDLFKGLMNNTSHVALMILVGTEDIEKFDPDYLIVCIESQSPEVKELF